VNYEEALEYLFPLVRYGTKLGLDNMTELLHRIGDPHRSLKVIHVAGSKGKGSVCAFISSILKEAGYKVGTFTSPHLVDARAVSVFAVVEAGMGGRYDSTNVVRPLVAVITHLSLEHSEHLGRSLNRIAKDKAGTIKEGVPVILAEESEPIRERCNEKGCDLTVLGKDIEFGRDSFDLSGQDFWVQNGGRHSCHINMLGNYQVQNAALAYAVAIKLKELGHEISDGSIERGFGNAKWPGRMHVLQLEPSVVVDTTHDVDGSKGLVESLKESFTFDNAILVFGALEDKEVSEMASILGPFFDTVIATESQYRKALPVDLVKKAFKDNAKNVETETIVSTAIEKALSEAGKNDLICITGSIFTASEAFAYFGKSFDD